MVGKSSVSIQSQAPGNWLRRVETRLTRIQKKKEPSRLGFAHLFLMTAAPQVQHSPPLPFQVDPGSGFAQPWGRSRGGGQPRPCGTRPASSLCGEPIAKVSQLAIISASPREQPQSSRTQTYLFPVVEALIVVFQSRDALLLARLALTRVHNVASENLLPEGVAAGGT